MLGNRMSSQRSRFSAILVVDAEVADDVRRVHGSDAVEDVLDHFINTGGHLASDHEAAFVFLREGRFEEVEVVGVDAEDGAVERVCHFFAGAEPLEAFGKRHLGSFGGNDVSGPVDWYFVHA